MKPLRVYTAGTFDLWHRGHVEFLRRCARLGDVTVAVNTDEFVARYKGQPPVIAYKDRAEVVRGCRYVAQVLPQDSDNLGPQIDRVRPDYLAVGSDWARRNYYTQVGVTQGWLDERGIVLVYVPYTAGISSTEIKRRLAA